MADDKEEPKIFSVSTVPPPAGESAYDAETKVGQLAGILVEEVRIGLARRGPDSGAGAGAAPERQKEPVAEAKPIAVAEAKPIAVAEAKPIAVAEAKPIAVAEAKPIAVAETPPPVSEAPESPPRVYDDAEEDGAATLLSRNARPWGIAHRPVADESVLGTWPQSTAPLTPPVLPVARGNRAARPLLLAVLLVLLMLAVAALVMSFRR